MLKSNMDSVKIIQRKIRKCNTCKYFKDISPYVPCSDCYGNDRWKSIENLYQPQIKLNISNIQSNMSDINLDMSYFIY